MELSDVIFGSRIRVVILALVVGIAVAISSVLTLQDPRQYSSKVAFVAPSTNRGNPSAVEQAVANLRANLGASAVVEAASDAGGITPEQVRGDLSIARRGASDTVELKYTSERRGVAEDVVEESARALVTEVTAVDIERAMEQTARLTTEVARIQTDFDAFMNENDLSIPDEEFRGLSAELTSLRVALANSIIDGSSRVPALQAAIDEKQTTLNALAPKVRRYQDFNLSIDRAQRRLDTAIDNEAAITSLLAGVEQGALTPEQEREVPRGPEVARAAAGAAGVAVVVCLLLFAMLEIRRAGALRRQARIEAARPVPPTVTTPAAAATTTPATGRPEGNGDLHGQNAPLGLR